MLNSLDLDTQIEHNTVFIYFTNDLKNRSSDFFFNKRLLQILSDPPSLHQISTLNMYKMSSEIRIKNVT